MKPLLLLLALGSLGGFLPAQVFVSFDEVQVLPALGHAPDHVLFEFNDDGDLFVAWQSDTTNGTTDGPWQVEGAFIRRTGPDTWLIPPASETILLGDPRLNLTGGEDNCQKPRVVSMGKDFVVAWARANDADLTARLEAVYIVPNPSGPPLVHGAGPGEGYLIDASYKSGESGNNIEMIAKRLPWKSNQGGNVDQQCVIAIPHQTQDFGIMNGYEVYLWRVNFKTLPPITDGPALVVFSVYVDDADNFGKGRLPVTLVEDDSGRLVLGYEEYLSSLRLGGGLPPEGRLRFHRIEDVNNQLITIDLLELHGDNWSHLQRRPILATSMLNSANEMTLAWVEFDRKGLNGRAHHGTISIGGGGMSYTDSGFVNDPTKPMRTAFPVQGMDRSYLIGTRGNKPNYEGLVWDPHCSLLQTIDTAGVPPVRVYAAIREEFTQSGQLFERLIPYTFDGADPTSGNLNIYFKIVRDPASWMSAIR